MKRVSIYIINLMVLALIASGCKKSFLEITPKGKQIARTTSDYDLLMNSSTIYFYPGTISWRAIALMGDEIAAEKSYFSVADLTAQNAFTWSDDLYGNQARFTDDLSFTVNIYTCNKVINEVMASENGSTAAKTNLSAEAQAERAWIYFSLINFYGKPYLASSAGSDPGFPIIKTADISIKNFTRTSVQEVYDFMIQDLTSAIGGLPLQNAVGPTRWSKAAAEGLLGKVYLFMGKNQQALDMFNAAFTDLSKQSTPPVLYDFNSELADGGKFFPIGSDGPNNSPGLNYADNTESVLSRTYYNGPTDGNGFGIDFVVLSGQGRSLFDDADLRLLFYAPQFPYETHNPSGRLSKYSEQYAKIGLQLPDLYLLRAEAKARLNNLSGAVADLLVLRQHRMPAAAANLPAGVASAQSSLLKFIIDERVREFATEGYRWMDMRRLSVDPLFANTSYIHTLYNDDTYTNVTTFKLRPERFLLRLPPYIMQANPNFPNNP